MKSVLEQVVSELRFRTFPTLENHDPEALERILERWSRAAQREFREVKQRHLRKYLVNTFICPITAENFDERESFLRALDELTELESQVLVGILHQDGRTTARGLGGDDDGSAIVGALHHLNSLGLASLHSTAVVIGSSVSISHDNVSAAITGLGRRFCEFCIAEEAAVT